MKVNSGKGPAPRVEYPERRRMAKQDVMRECLIVFICLSNDQLTGGKEREQISRSVERHVREPSSLTRRNSIFTVPSRGSKSCG